MVEIHEGEAIERELRELHELIRRGQQRWIEGRDEATPQHERMTLYGPFGGPVRVFDGASDTKQAAARAQFGGGESQVEIVRTLRSGDLAVVVSLSRNSVQFVGRAGRHPWELRVTEVYQRTDGHWTRLHRHADPLITPRPLVETLALIAPGNRI